MKNDKISGAKLIGSTQIRTTKAIAIFGDRPNDDLVLYKPRHKSRTYTLLDAGKKVNATLEDIERRMARIESLSHSEGLAMFTLQRQDLDLLQRLGKSKSVTHVNFLSREKSIKALLFDCRIFDSILRLHRKNTLKVFEHDFHAESNLDFVFSMKVSTLLILPKNDYLVRIGDNGVGVFEDSANDTQYLIRDQKATEPFISFFSPRLNSNIVFSPDPKT